jgi:hypothetical protein
VQQTAQATISVSSLVQLYAPLVGLLVMAFWLGVLSQRVRVSERRQDATDAALKAATAETTTVAVLGSNVGKMEKTLEKMEREMAGVQRALSKIATGEHGPITRFEQE